MAVGSIGAAATEPSVGTAAIGAADSVLDSTLSSKLRAAVSMQPPQPHTINSKQRCRHCYQRDGDAAVPEACEEFERPRKLQRTLSMSRTKSVSVGLDQIFDAAVGAAAVGAADGVRY
jgi:ribosomal protein S14